MKPRILKVDPYKIDRDKIEQAAEYINNRGLVAFPTETVYGLGADALDPKAVAGIFKAKKRPLDDPLIVHIASIEDLYRLAKDIPPVAEKLGEAFWPGPLTMVLKKKELVPDLVTTGLDTLALRMPSSLIAKKLIETAGVPIAAPSANLFGRPSPTKAEHVLEDLKDRIDVLIDGGATEIGIESTVVEIGPGRVSVLRPGGVGVEEIRRIAGRVDLIPETSTGAGFPGRYPKHYSPRAVVILVPEGPDQAEKVKNIYVSKTGEGLNAGILSKQEHDKIFDCPGVKVLGPGDDGKTCASRLFGLLREFDNEDVDVVIAESIPENGLGLGVMNRLRKASGKEEQVI